MANAPTWSIGIEPLPVTMGAVVQTSNLSSAIAAAIILIVFGLFAYFLPRIMLAVGGYSPIAAGVVVVVFLGGLFIVLWLRGRYQRRRGE
jgi:hypothetical protein